MNKYLKKLKEIIENSDKWFLESETEIKCVSELNDKNLMLIDKVCVGFPPLAYRVHLVEDNKCLYSFDVNNTDEDVKQKACFNVINKIFNKLQQSEVERFLNNF